MSQVYPPRPCRLCRRRLERDWAQAPTKAERDSLLRQMNNGMCDACQRARQEAAVEFIRAADAIRLAWRWAMARYGPAAIDHEPMPGGRTSLPGPHVFPAWYRMTDAAARCVDLRMWRDGRTRPPRHP